MATAVLDQAKVLWLPNITIGADYLYHNGPIQDVSNAVYNNSHGALLVGAGSGIGQTAVISVDDAIFAPLYAKQQVKAREADRQAASNDTLVAVSDAYFTVQQARGELAGIIEAMRRTEDLVARTRKLAPGVIPEEEMFRAETELARRQQTELLARERWKVASAELLAVLLLDPLAQVEPSESPQLQVELIDLKKPLDDLIPVGLTYRPELASQQAHIQAALALVRQERLRPFIPNVLLRGASTNPAGTLGAGFFSPNPNGGSSGFREDVDLQLLWQLDNLGFGNAGKIRQREAESDAAKIELSRVRIRVAKEVAQAYAQAQLATRRVQVAEKGLQSAVKTADKNLEALRQVKGVGAQFVTLVRPQEVIAAIQAMAQAYTDYFGAIADANRAQFRLYRALGQPAQYLIQDEQAPRLCATSSAQTDARTRFPGEAPSSTSALPVEKDKSPVEIGPRSKWKPIERVSGTSGGQSP